MEKKSNYVLKLLFFCFGIFTFAETDAQFNVPASEEDTAGMITLQSEDDFPGVEFFPDIAYINYGETNLFLHLISPSQSSFSESIPLVIFVPGSAWFAQDLAQSVPQMIDFAKQSGYVVAIVSYRPSNVAKSPAQLIDIKTAVRFLKANAGHYKIDPERVAIWGTSSGGHIASMVGVTQGIELFETNSFGDQSSDVAAVIDFYGPSDFLQMDEFPSIISHNEDNSPESSVIGGPIQDINNLEKVREYNPITYIAKNKDIPPFLIMHGDIDPLVPFNQSLILYEALRDAKKEASFYKIIGAGHGSRFFTPKTISIVNEFLKKNFQ
jgi:acetyl esterase/lipase